MNKKQTAKRAKRKLTSRQKKKQRNKNKVQKKKASNKKREELMKFFKNLSKSKQKDILKSIEEGE